MQTLAPLFGSRKSDPHKVKQWATEDFAISAGLLRECPYHGQPFRAPRSIHRNAVAAIDPRDPNVRAFNGNTRELLAAVERVTGRFGDHCEMCAASDQDDTE